MANGHVILDRSITNWRWYKDANASRLFIHCILMANYTDCTIGDVVIHRGEFLTSYSTLAENLGLTVKEVRTALGKLKRTQEVASTSTSKYTIISIVNYDLYQCNGKHTGNQAANRGQSEGKQRSTNNKDNNIKEVDIKKEKNIKKESFSVPPEIADAFAGFSEMRTKIKKPLTDRAKKMALHKLQELAPNDYAVQTRILDQSTENCWLGLYPLKDKDGGERRGTARNNVADDTPFGTVY